MSETGYDAVDDTTNIKVPDVTSDAIIVQYDTLAIKKYTVTTDYMYDDVKFTLEGLDRTLNLPGLGFAEIKNFDGAVSKFVYDGYIGILPYQSLPEVHRPFSFIKQLYDRNIISH
jgi:hypothetical protein